MADKAKDTTKKTRGDGPVTISYLDAEGKVHKRVPEKGVAVRVTDKNGKHSDLKLADLSPAVVNGLALFALGRKQDTYVRNTVKNDGTADVIGTAKELFEVFKKGQIYTRKEGTGGGREFDIERWINIMTEAAKLQKNPLTDKKVASLRAVLMSLQGRERQGQILKWQKNPFVKVVIAKQKMAEDKAGSVADLF